MTPEVWHALCRPEMVVINVKQARRAIESNPCAVSAMEGLCRLVWYFSLPFPLERVLYCTASCAVWQILPSRADDSFVPTRISLIFLIFLS
jgi:hypothetical protein